jgi:hypothetical protein
VNGIIVAKRRVAIPARLTEQALFAADHTCCICRVAGKDVQLHHIDGNPSNNSADNLAVVCLDCHSRVTGTRGLGQPYRAGEVRRYKRSWDLQVQDRRRVHRPNAQHEKQLVSQIDLLVCEILALDPRSSRIPTLFRLFYELHLWRGSRRLAGALLDGAGHLAIMGGLGEDHVARHLPEFLWRLCWHFVGPHEVRMDRVGVAHVRRCLDVMDTLADFTCGFGRSRRTIAAVTTHTEKLFEVSLWYSNATIADDVIKLYRKALVASEGRGRRPFSYGRVRLRRSIGNLRRLAQEQKPRWRWLDRRLATLVGETRGRRTRS